MHHKINLFVATLLSLLALSITAYATPSTTYWTPMTPDIQSYGVPHIGVDNYFTLFRNAQDKAQSFSPDVTLLEIGVLPFEKLQMEIGADLVDPTNDPTTGKDYPLFFNAKIGSPENTLFQGSPALYLGVFNAGTKKDVTNQNTFYGTIGKTIPILGRLSAGPYIGNKNVLVDKDGDKANTGFMVAYDRGFIPVKDHEGNEYSKIVFAADYASGKNAIGGGGFGLYYFFTKDISLLTGPMWFNEEAINGKWKWTIQLDINLPPVFGK